MASRDPGLSTQLKKHFNRLTGRLFGFEIALKTYHPDVIPKVPKALAARADELLAMEYGFFDPANDEFHLVHVHHAGLFSCLSVTLWSLCDLIGAGHVPRKINFSASLAPYVDEPASDVYEQLFRQPDVEALAELRAIDRRRFVRFDHHSSYGALDVDLLSRLIGIYLRPNRELEERVVQLTDRYLRPDRRYVGVCIRGTDKWVEVAPTDSSFYIEAAAALLDGGQADRVLIQTDQAQICDLFKYRFGDACDVIEALPRTSGKAVIHSGALLEGKRIEFARNIIAAVSILSTMTHVVTHTGNVGVWIVLLRGSSRDLWQATPGGIVLQ